MNTPAILDRLVALEADVTYRDPPGDGGLPFRHMPGTLPVLLSAPHGAAHRRDGRYKQEDEFTAALVRLVAERSGAHALYAFARSGSDPNHDPRSPYKTALAELVAAHDIRLVLDIHGMSNRHKFGVALGTMRGASCRPRHETLAVEALTAAGFTATTAAEARDFPALRWDRFVVNHRRFTGGLTSHTVTRFAAEEIGIHAMQFELCGSLRIVRRRGTPAWPDDFRGDPDGIARVVAVLERLARALASRET